MAQQTLNRPDGDERSKIDRDYDREFNAAVAMLRARLEVKAGR